MCDAGIYVPGISSSCMRTGSVCVVGGVQQQWTGVFVCVLARACVRGVCAFISCLLVFFGFFTFGSVAGSEPVSMIKIQKKWDILWHDFFAVFCMFFSILFFVVVLQW